MDEIDCNDEAEQSNLVERLLEGREAIALVGHAFIASAMKVDPASPSHSSAARKVALHNASDVFGGAQPTSSSDVARNAVLLGAAGHSASAVSSMQQHSLQEAIVSIQPESYHAPASKQPQLRGAMHEKPCKPEVELLNIKRHLGAQLVQCGGIIGMHKPF